MPGVLRAIAAAVLVSGWLVAAVILVRAARAERDADAVAYEIVGHRVYPLTLAQSRRTRQFVQRVDGDMGVWIVEFDDGLRSLLRPPRLGWTVWVLSTLIGVGCLELAKLSGEDVDERDGDAA